MSKLNNPKLTIQIEGKQQIRDMYIVESFKPARVFENTLNLNSEIDWVSIFPSIQSPVRKIIIEAPILDLSVEQVYAIEVRTTIVENVTGQSQFVEEVESQTIKSYSEAFGANILNVEVRSTSPVENTKEIKSRIYAWED